MNPFKLIMEGIKVPAGETYSAVEGANGELGFYVVRRQRRAVSGAGAVAMFPRDQCAQQDADRPMIPDIITTSG